MTTKWEHLPNAKHIDWVLASVKTHPEKWSVTRDATRDAVWRAGYDVVRKTTWSALMAAGMDMILDVTYDALQDMTDDAEQEEAVDNAWSSILALTAYDDCAYMIESEVDELRIIAAFGDPRAILLLPACIVFNETREND